MILDQIARPFVGPHDASRRGGIECLAKFQLPDALRRRNREVLGAGGPGLENAGGPGMSKLLRGLAAGWGAKKLGGGCLSTILVFVLLWYVLGHFEIFR
jgi:hypothetical protein